MHASWAALAIAVLLPLVEAVHPLAFGPAVKVMDGPGEPGLAIGPDAALYAFTLAGFRDRVAKSTDGGATWAVLPVTNLPFGGGDDHVVVAPDNTVYLAGQWTIVNSFCVSVAQGLAGGTAWAIQPYACVPTTDPLRRIDRPWLALSATGPVGHTVYLYMDDPCCSSRHVVLRSTDHGATWQLRGEPFLDGIFPGNLVVDDAAGLLYAITTPFGPFRVGIARSADGGLTWTPRTVALLTDGDDGLNHVFLAKDAAGNLYTAWTDRKAGTGFQVWFSRSLDHGDTWSTPLQITSGSGTRVFPTIAAGSAGRVAIAWYETPVSGNPNDPSVMNFNALWTPKAAGSWNADGPAPTFTFADVADEPNHRGVICTRGAVCAAQGLNRQLLDFFTVQVDAADRANVVWGKDLGDPFGTMFARSV